VHDESFKKWGFIVRGDKDPSFSVGDPLRVELVGFDRVRSRFLFDLVRPD
jgi:hypothetical protein